MKRFIAGLIIGLLLATAGLGLASNDVIRIFINGQEIYPDVPPQIINGRVMVPARFIAEPLGATVEWDEKNRAVVIQSQSKNNTKAFDVDLNEWVSIRELYGSKIKEYPRALEFQEQLFNQLKDIKDNQNVINVIVVSENPIRVLTIPDSPIYLKKIDIFFMK